MELLICESSVYISYNSPVPVTQEEIESISKQSGKTLELIYSESKFYIKSVAISVEISPSIPMCEEITILASPTLNSNFIPNYKHLWEGRHLQLSIDRTHFHQDFGTLPISCLRILVDQTRLFPLSFVPFFSQLETTNGEFWRMKLILTKDNYFTFFGKDEFHPYLYLFNEYDGPCTEHPAFRCMMLDKVTTFANADCLPYHIRSLETNSRYLAAHSSKMFKYKFLTDILIESIAVPELTSDLIAKLCGEKLLKLTFSESVTFDLPEGLNLVLKSNGKILYGAEHVSLS
jgi:hypothetical protein